MQSILEQMLTEALRNIMLKRWKPEGQLCPRTPRKIWDANRILAYLSGKPISSISISFYRIFCHKYCTHLDFASVAGL